MTPPKRLTRSPGLLRRRCVGLAWAVDRLTESGRPARDSYWCKMAVRGSRGLRVLVGITLHHTVRALSTCSSPPFVIATDAHARRTSESSREFLATRPAGAYTTARTCAGCSKIFEWETHVRRTAGSARAMIGAAGISGLENLCDPLALRERLDRSVAAAVMNDRELEAPGKGGGDMGELKVTILVSWKGDATSVVETHISPLPPLPQKPVRVEVRGAPRSDATSKDSTWVTERAPLEELMRAADSPEGCGAVNEFLMTNDDGEVYEGSQTNFFALGFAGVGETEPFLQTAGEGVLEGTVRRLLLEVCQNEGIKVNFSPPRIEDCYGSRPVFHACFISSTSRLLLPVDELYIPPDGDFSREAHLMRKFDRIPIVDKLVKLVNQEVENHSTPIACK